MKEETAVAPRPAWLSVTQSQAFRKWLVPALFVVLAFLVTTGYGTGVQLNDGQADLHIDPLKFLWSLLHAWNPSLYLGTHTGFWFPYETPYAWFYAFAQIFHVPQDLAQRTAVFLVYLGCLASMYYCLRSVAPWLDEASRIAGSCAYLFNMYVALNSQAQIVWLLTYGTLPAMVGITARAIRNEIDIWRGSLGIALLVLVGGGINPPLVGINVILLAIFVAVMVALSPNAGQVARRTLPFLVVSAIATLAINLYWVVPFVDFFRHVWLNGVLSEGPSLHNAATSFENVLRGLGHWATFVSFNGRAYFPWAAPYESGFLSAMLWFVPIVAIGGVGLRTNQRPATLYFLLATIVSVPIVVGYYHDALGDAVTTPIYDAFYRYFPGFQMFRFSYKWVAGVEFGISALYALSVSSILSWLREQIASMAAVQRNKMEWVVPAAAGAFVIIPILIFTPVLIYKMNYPGSVLPSWEYREKALVGNDDRHRVALFPTQFLEQFDWGNPEFYIENSLVDRPMIYGLLGSEPSEGTDMWVRRAYRVTREGLTFAPDLLRVMGVDTILQRDDFIPAIDFSSPEEARYNTTTLTHDLIHRVLGATPVRSDGPLHVYRIAGALPFVYGVEHPVVSTVPVFTDGYLGDISQMARGQASFNPQLPSADDFTTQLQALSPILPQTPDQVRDLAVNEALDAGIRVHPPSAEADWVIPFEAKRGGEYAIFAREQSLLFPKAPPQTLDVDGVSLGPQTGGAWTGYGQMVLSSGRHSVSNGYTDPDLVVAFVPVEALRGWTNRIEGLMHALPHNLAISQQVYARKAIVRIPASGRYRVAVTSVGPFGPDGLAKTALARGASYRGSFPANLGTTLPYVLGDGAIGTSAIMMPERWYRDAPGVYDWQRGDSESWFLFPRNARVNVFVAGSHGVNARVTMHVSRLQVANAMYVSANGSAPTRVDLDGPPAEAQAYDSIDELQGPVPVTATFTLALRPGWNTVAFSFTSLGGERGDLGAGVISAAVAPDLSFTRIGTTNGSSAPTRDGAFTAVAVDAPPSSLMGDPSIVGNVALAPGQPAWVAVALVDRGSTLYRLFPISSQASFDISFMHAFPNNWFDGAQRVAGVWLLSRGGSAKFSGLFYDLHGLPARDLRHPAALANLPIRIDGRLIAAQPVALRAGSHLVTSADPEVKIGLLRIDPVSLPKTQSFRMNWQRNSPTSLDVTAPNSPNPFLLVMGDAFHPEWRATLDGKQLDHVIVDGVSNGWIVPSLPAGGTISLRFVGQNYYIVAAVISLLSFALLLTLACNPRLWPIGSDRA